jgi:Cof subfamily protein (haloacid dehalogenase superfamily)
MKYKLIAIDMDGTLLNSQHEISERNKVAIKSASEKGVKIVITTGRIFTSAKYYAKLLGITTPIIACNGAFISEYNKNNVLYDNPMRLDDCIEILNAAEEHGMYCHLYDNQNFYVRELKYSSQKYYEWNNRQKPEDRINIHIDKNLTQLLKDKKPEIYKMVIIDEDKSKLSNFKEIIQNNNNIEIVSSWHNNVEVMNKEVSKGNALYNLCKILDIRSEEVIAIGDNYNDASMFKYSGVSVAMGNAEIEIKEIADLVTDTNDNDGVGKAIENLVL